MTWHILVSGAPPASMVYGEPDYIANERKVADAARVFMASIREDGAVAGSFRGNFIVESDLTHPFTPREDVPDDPFIEPTLAIAED